MLGAARWPWAIALTACWFMPTVASVAQQDPSERPRAEVPRANQRHAPITAVAIAGDGRSAVVASQDEIAVLAWPSLERTGVVPWEEPAVHDVAFSPSEKWLAICGGAPARQGAWAVLHWPSGKLERSGRVGDDVLYQLDWDPSGQWLAFACGDASARCVSWRAQGADLESAVSTEPRALQGHSKSVLCAAFYLESSLLTAGRDATLRVWDWRGGELRRSLNQHTHEVLDLAVAPRPDALGRMLVASASADRTVRFWQADIGRLIRFCRLASPPTSIAWSDDASALLAVCRDGRLRVIDPQTVEVLDEMPAVEGWAYSVATYGDDALVGGESGRIARVRWRR